MVVVVEFDGLYCCVGVDGDVGYCLYWCVVVVVGWYGGVDEYFFDGLVYFV